MIAELGAFSLILAAILALMQAVGYAVPRLKLLSFQSVIMQAMCCAISFTCLLMVHLDSDFSVLNVAENSHSTTALLYKLSGAWGNHEGSFLLWVTILSLYGAGLAITKITDPLLFNVRHKALALHGLMQAGFIAFVLFTSNPFSRLAEPPEEGKGLNPLLQDVGLAIHPPILYLGYVGFGLVFTLGMAALWEGKPLGKSFAAFIRPWVLIPWGFMGLGIGLGSWWAYRELGWGGWWFWDPVENASLLPWLCGTALLHANAVLLKRGQLLHWTILLSIFTFSLSLIGTFLVRSGIITSVHSFASDPTRGVFILTYLALLSGSALTLYSFRAHRLGSGAPLIPLSREGSIVINNLFLLVATASILLATLYPMIQELLGARSLTIGAPYFNKTFFPLMTPLMLLAGVGALLPWRMARLNSQSLRQRLTPAIVCALASVCLTVALAPQPHPWLLIGNTLGGWIIGGTLSALSKAISAQELTLTQRLSRMRHLSASFYAMFLAHLGLGLLVIAIACSGTLRQEKELRLAEGETGTLGNWSVHYEKFGMQRTASFVAFKPFITLQHHGQTFAHVRPERRLYPLGGTWTTEAAIATDGWADIYLSLRSAGPSETEKQQGKINPITLTLYINPAIPLLWLSMLLIGIGGFVGVLGKKKSTTHG